MYIYVKFTAVGSSISLNVVNVNVSVSVIW